MKAEAEQQESRAAPSASASLLSQCGDTDIHYWLDFSRRRLKLNGDRYLYLDLYLYIYVYILFYVDAERHSERAEQQFFDLSVEDAPEVMTLNFHS